MWMCVVTVLTHVDAGVAKVWIPYWCVPCHPWCTHRTSLVVTKKTFPVFLWLWTIVIVINICNHGERTLWNALYIINAAIEALILKNNVHIHKMIHMCPHMGKMVSIFTKIALYKHHRYPARKMISVRSSLDKDISKRYWKDKHN
jgi:hypothetical protein